jgi:transposase
MQLYLSELSSHIKENKHIALVMDNAGWHIAKELVIPNNITIVPLPAYAPELNATEQVWQWLKLNYLSNRCYSNYTEIVDSACYAWNQFSNQPDLVKSLCTRDWCKIP